MNCAGKLLVITSCLINSMAFSMNPIQGFYGGILGEISHGPSSEPVIFKQDATVFIGKVNYSSISGGGGAMIGYKYLHFRAEGELLINRISTGPVTVGTCTIENKNAPTPTGACPAGIYDHFKANALGFSGNSTAYYGLFNAIWDFYSDTTESDIAPYLGLGGGYASIRNGNSFVHTTTQYSSGSVSSTNGAAFQGILGISYYMDDFTWASLDFRYLTAQRKANQEAIANNISTSRYTLNTLNITVNFAFDHSNS